MPHTWLSRRRAWQSKRPRRSDGHQWWSRGLVIEVVNIENSGHFLVIDQIEHLEHLECSL
jgi:hypothetical protein